MKTEKIKVLHLIASRGIGGAEKILLSLSKNINRDEFDLILGIFMDKRRKDNVDLFWKEAEKLEFALETIKLGNPYDLLQIRDIYRVVKRHHPDIIHTHGYRTNMLGFFVAKLLGIPIVTTIHGYQNNNETRTIVQISSLLIRYFDQVIAVSDEINDNLKHRMIAPSGKITTIRNVPSIADGEDLTSGSKFREEIGIPPQVRVVGFVGRLERVKGCYQFIQAISIVARSIRDVYFVVTGEGSERESLEHQIKEEGLEDKVYFSGFRHDMASIYHALDLYVLPSLNEGVPLTLLEAMFYGIPVVATRVGGVPEVIQNGVNGILVAPDDPKALAESIVESLNNRDDTEKRIIKARNTINSEYDVKRWAEKIGSVYAEIKKDIG